MTRLIVSSRNKVEWNIAAHFEADSEDSPAADTKIVPLRSTGDNTKGGSRNSGW